jgi:hypothetical protein
LSLTNKEMPTAATLAGGRRRRAVRRPGASNTRRIMGIEVKDDPPAFQYRTMWAYRGPRQPNRPVVGGRFERGPACHYEMERDGEEMEVAQLQAWPDLVYIAMRKEPIADDWRSHSLADAQPDVVVYGPPSSFTVEKTDDAGCTVDVRYDGPWRGAGQRGGGRFRLRFFRAHMYEDLRRILQENARGSRK